MRRIFVYLAFALALVGGTAFLMWFSTASAARFEVDGDRVTLSGQLTLASTERLDRLLEQNGDLSTLVLGEIGTGSDATSLLQKGGLIRAAGLSTEVAPGVTLRGDAVYLFLAGISREMGGDARLIVTSWQSSVGPAESLPRDHPAHQERLDYVTRMLGAPDFYWYSLEAAGSAAHEMNAEELVALNVVTPG